MDHRQVVEWLHQFQIGQSAQNTVRRLLHAWVEMHGVHQVDVIGVVLGQLAQHGENELHRPAQALSPMGGDQHDPPVEIDARQRPLAEIVWAGGDLLERVDDRVAGDDDAPFDDPLAKQILAGLFGRGKMQIGHRPGHAPVDLLGKGMPFVARAQAGLDMPDADVMIEGQERGRHHGGRVPLDHDPVGGLVLEDRLQPGEHTRRQLRQALVRAHQIQIEIRMQVEQI